MKKIVAKALIIAVALAYHTAQGEPVAPGFIVETYAELPFRPERISIDPCDGAIYAGNALDAYPCRIYKIEAGGSSSAPYGDCNIWDPDVVLFVEDDWPNSGTSVRSGSLLVGGHDPDLGVGCVTIIEPNEAAYVLFSGNSLLNPYDMCFDNNGRLLIAELDGVLQSSGVPPSLLFPTIWSKPVEEVAVNQDGLIYTGYNNGIITVHNSAGNLVDSEFAGGLGTHFILEFGIGGVWGTDLYVLCVDQHKLVRVDPKGSVTEIGTGFDSNYRDIEFGPDGALYISDVGQQEILRIYPETVCWVEQAKLLASDGAALDTFGLSVAISDNIAIVGAKGDDDAGTDSGSAYLFDVVTGTQLAKLTASDGAADDWFGYTGGVAVSGDTAIVGAFGDDTTAGTDSGSAYVFDISDPCNPVQTYKLTACDAAAGDHFGAAVAISGNTAIVGAYGNDDDGSESGSAYLFDVTSGSQLFKLTASDAAAGDYFGYFAVAISGNTAIVGAYWNDDAGTNSGSAYLFDVTTGTQLAKLTACDAAANDEFGLGVGISGNIAIVGARCDDDAGSKSGSAYLFDVTDPYNPVRTYKLTASDAAAGDEFGSSVSISGNYAIVGSFLDDDNGSNSGSAYLFEVSDPYNPVEIDKTTASDTVSGDQFGHSVSVSGDYAIVGAYGDDDNGTDSGSAYVFENICEPEGTFVQIDIKPGSCPNPVNVKSKGVLPVAILGTDKLDVSDIDPASVRLEGVAPLRWSYEDVATPVTVDGGPIAYWSFDDAANPGHDDSGNWHDGIVNGGSSCDDKCGISERAYCFNGEGDYINTGYFAFGRNESLTVYAQFRCPTIGVNPQAILGYNAGGSHPVTPAGVLYMALSDDDGHLVAELMDDDGNWSRVDTNDNYADGQWHTAIFRRDVTSDTISLKIEDEYICAEDETTTTITLKHFSIGCQYTEDRGGYWDGYEGAIDEVRIYDRALSESEIAELADCMDGCECTTEGPDGYTDLTLKFETQAIVEALGELVDGEELILELTGELGDGTPILGEDCVVIRPKSDGKPE